MTWGEGPPSSCNVRVQAKSVKVTMRAEGTAVWVTRWHVCEGAVTVQRTGGVPRCQVTRWSQATAHGPSQANVCCTRPCCLHSLRPTASCQVMGRTLGDEACLSP